MRKSILALSISAIIFYSSASAQKNFRPASVALLNGDTLVGQVNYQGWKKNPARIQFRGEPSSSTQIFDVNRIESFEVDGDVYRRAVVEVDTRFDDIKRLTTDDTIMTRTDTVFLHALVTGSKQLFHYFDGVDHFYTLNQNTFELLRYKRYATQIVYSTQGSRARAITHNREYVQQLSRYFPDCGSISRQLENTDYKVRDLRSVFMAYYDCIKATPKHVSKPENEKLEAGFIAGMSNTMFTVTSTTGRLVGRVDYSNSTNLTGGVFADIIFPRQRGRMSLYNDLMYSEYNVKGYWREEVNAIHTEERTFTFGYSYIKLNTMFRYRLFLKKAAIFINGGVSNGTFIKETNSLETVRTISGNTSRYKDVGEPQTRKYEFGLVGGLGLKFGRLSVEGRAERGNGSFTYPQTQARVVRYTGLVGYRFR